MSILAAGCGRVFGGVAERVDVWGVHLAVEHEVRLQENILDQGPLELLIRELDRLTGQAEAHENNKQDDNEVEQVDELETKKQGN